MSSVYDLRTFAPAADGSPVKFPTAPYASAASYFDAYAEETARAASSIEPAALDRAAAILLEAYTARCRGVLVRQWRLGVDREPPAMRPREGRPDDNRPRPPRDEPQHQRRTAHRDSQRHWGMKTSSSTSFSRSRQPGDVLIAVSSSGRSPNIVRALHLGPRPRPPHDRDHRLRRRRGQDGRRGRHSRRLHELRHRRGLAPGHHARPGPVHPPVANDRGRDLGDCVLNHGSRSKLRCDAKAGAPILRKESGRYACAWRSTS